MTFTTVISRLGTKTYDDITDFEIDNKTLILERSKGQSWVVYADGTWYEADINVVRGELDD